MLFNEHEIRSAVAAMNRRDARTAQMLRRHRSLQLAAVCVVLGLLFLVALLRALAGRP